MPPLTRRTALALPLAALAPRAMAAHDLSPVIDFLETALPQHNVHGAALHVSQGPHSTRWVYGTAEKKQPAVFLLASITKPMTATAVMLLADRGQLTLDDPVHKFIPEFTAGSRKNITIRHLLTHTSGLPDMLPENNDLRRRNAPLKEFVERTIRTPLLFEPGTRVKYQSMGILLAAEVAERITTERFRKFLAREVYRPLGLPWASLGLGKIPLEHLQPSQVRYAGPPYDTGEDVSHWAWNSVYWRDLGSPWGGAHASAEEVGTWLRAFLEPDRNVLKPETIAQMIVDQNKGLNEPRGLGFVVKPGAFGEGVSEKAFGHGGSTGTLCWADPETDATFTLLTTMPARASRQPISIPASIKARTRLSSRSHTKADRAPA